MKTGYYINKEIKLSRSLNKYYLTMKTQKIGIFRSVTNVFIVISLLAFAACGSNQGNSTGEEKQSADSQTNSEPPSTGIHAAALLGDLDAIQQHIKAGTNLNEKDDYGSGPLTIAATFDKTEVARALIGAGADINITNNDGATVLHTAAFLCRKEIVEALLKNGVDKSVKNNFGSTALESVSGPFDEVRGIYDGFSKALGPLGFKLDYEYLESTRPIIAEMLQQ